MADPPPGGSHVTIVVVGDVPMLDYGTVTVVACTCNYRCTCTSTDDAADRRWRHAVEEHAPWRSRPSCRVRPVRP